MVACTAKKASYDLTDVVSSNLDQGEVYNIMWKDLRCDRLMVYSGSSTNKTDRHDITEILLKLALNIINH